MLTPTPRHAAALALGLALALPVRARSDELITWLVSDGVVLGQDATQLRPSATLVELLGRLLPRAQRVREANVKRAWAAIADGQQACATSAVRTPEREGLALFSDLLLMPPPVLIVRQEDASALPQDGQGQVDLGALLGHPRLRGALGDGRSYGRQIDALLQSRAAAVPLLRLPSASAGDRMIELLSLHRADYVIEHDAALAALGARAGEFRSLPILGASDMLRVGIACPRTPWGRSVIEAIDASLATAAAQSTLHELQTRMVSPDLRRHHAKAIAAFEAARGRATPRR